MLLYYLLRMIMASKSLTYLLIGSFSTFTDECCTLLEAMAQYTRKVEYLRLYCCNKNDLKQSVSFGKTASAIVAQNDCLKEIGLRVLEIPVEFTNALQKSPSVAWIRILKL